MSYLIAKNEDDYIRIALELTQNIEKLNLIRKKVFETAPNSPLFNVHNFSKNFFEIIKNL